MLRRVVRGQSLPLVVLMLALIFLTIGLGVDGGLLYAQRRLMQNSADAACLAAATRLAMGESSTQAEQAARDAIAANLGATPGGGANAPGTLSYTTVSELYTPSIGSGVDLARGIELDGPRVRVALRSPAFTHFMRLLGQTEYTVAARAHCDASAGGGGMPFAVARWLGFNQSGSSDSIPSTDQSLSSQVGGQKGAATVRDILTRSSAPPLASAGSGGEWPDWGTSAYPGSPASATGLFRQPTSSSVATRTNPGVEVVIAGQGARANGDNSFTGPVLLDVRNITFSSVEFYSGIDLQQATNPNKDFISRHILEGYRGSLVPSGTQLAYTSGVSAGQVQKPFALRHQVNDIVSVLIFNGTIYSAADFATSFPTTADGEELRSVSLNFSVADRFPPNCDFSAVSAAYMNDTLPTMQPWSYRLRVEPFRNKSGKSQDPYASTFALRAFSSQSPATWNGLEWRWSGGGWGGLTSEGVPTAVPMLGAGPAAATYTLDLRQTLTDTCISSSNPLSPTIVVENAPLRPQEGTLSLYLEAKDRATGLRRGQYALLALNAQSSDFWVYTPSQVAYAPIELSNKSESLAQEFRIQRRDGTLLRANSSGVAVGAPTWFTVDEQSEAVGMLGGAPSGISAAINVRSGTNYIDINLAPTAATGKSYYVRFPISYGGKTQWLWYYLAVKPAMSNSSSMQQYVYSLGYANFIITEIGSNSIKGRAVSGLLDPEDMIAGLQPRLIPWE